MATLEVRKKRSKVKINYDYPVVVISRSNNHIMAQLLEPVTKKTLFTVTSQKLGTMPKTEKSTMVGKEVAEKLKAMKIEEVLFDRNGYRYHGRVKALADGIRDNGIKI
jgi:large subunit ribosomal protein L18